MFNRNASEWVEAWVEGLSSEISFWHDYMASRGGSFKEKYMMNVEPDKHFSLEDDIPENMYGKEYKFIDVGSGPFSRCGYVTDKVIMHNYAADPLADAYRVLKNRYYMNNGVYPECAFVEMLDKKYPENYFDMVHMSNSLDHSFDAVLGIYQLLRICRIGGKIILRHEDNVAEESSYNGLHQWNLTAKYDTNEFLIWRQKDIFNITEMFKDYADVSCRPDPLEPNVFHRVEMVKKKDIDIPKNDMCSIMLDKIYSYTVGYMLENSFKFLDSKSDFISRNIIKMREIMNYNIKPESFANLKKVSVYGLGTLGEELIILLRKMGIEIHSALDKREMRFMDINTVDPTAAVFDKTADKIIITAYGAGTVSNIRSILIKNGALPTQIITIDELLGTK